MNKSQALTHLKRVMPAIAESVQHDKILKLSDEDLHAIQIVIRAADKNRFSRQELKNALDRAYREGEDEVGSKEADAIYRAFIQLREDIDVEFVSDENRLSDFIFEVARAVYKQTFKR